MHFFFNVNRILKNAHGKINLILVLTEYVFIYVYIVWVLEVTTDNEAKMQKITDHIFVFTLMVLKAAEELKAVLQSAITHIFISCCVLGNLYCAISLPSL